MGKPFFAIVSLFAIVVGLITMSSPAFAHRGIGDTAGLAHGFLHPLGGVDHELAMIAVGLFAAHLGGRALWLVPLSFVAMMAVGGAAGMAEIDLPFVEFGIGLSVVVLGLTVAFRFDVSTMVAMGLVGFFAIFHGHAHGAEMPGSVSGFAYGAGFMVATALLHVAGIALGLGVGRLSTTYGRVVLRGTGGAMALAGAAILSGVI